MQCRYLRKVESLLSMKMIRRSYGIFNKMTTRLDHPAVLDSDGSHSYGTVLQRALALRDTIEKAIGPMPPHASQPRVAYLAPRRHTYVTAKCATWLYGGVGVPLAEGYPADELEYVLTDSGASTILVDPSLKNQVAAVAAKLKLPLIEVAPAAGDGTSPPASEKIASRVSAAIAGRCPSDGAYFVYTSGTTGKVYSPLLPSSHLYLLL